LILREEHRKRVFENTVLKGMSGPRRDRIMGDWIEINMMSFIIFNPREIKLQ
jgi:hypothetical protein